jgi:hypothetical protein
VAGAGRARVLVVSGHPWARDLAAALNRSGLGVRMWVGPASDRAAARAAGLEADRGRMIVDAVSREAELEEITDALLLTRSDDFNALAAAELRSRLGHGHVYRVAPDPEEPDLLPPSTEAGILGNTALTFAELDRRFAAGARFLTRDDGQSVSADGGPPDVPLFALNADGQLTVAADGRPLETRAGARLIVLSRAPSPPLRSPSGPAGASCGTS